MPLKTFKNPNTGETVTFDWKERRAPTPEDVQRISDEQRQARIDLKKQAAVKEEPSFKDKLYMGVPGWAIKAAESIVPKEFPWESIPGGVKQIGRGLQQVATGEGPEATAKWGIPGIKDIGEGAMRALSFPMEAAGLATNPVGTLAGFGAAHVATPYIQEGVEALAPNLPPEVKGLATDIGSLATGVAAGGLAHKFVGPKVGGVKAPKVESITAGSARMRPQPAPVTSDVPYGPFPDDRPIEGPVNKPLYGPEYQAPYGPKNKPLYGPIRDPRPNYGPQDVTVAPPSGPIPDQVKPVNPPPAPPAEPTPFPARVSPPSLPESSNGIIHPEPPPSFPPRMTAPQLPGIDTSDFRPGMANFQEPLRTPETLPNVPPPDTSGFERVMEPTPGRARPTAPMGPEDFQGPEVQLPRPFKPEVKAPEEADVAVVREPQVKEEPESSEPAPPKSPEDIAREAIARSVEEAPPEEVPSPEEAKAPEIPVEEEKAPEVEETPEEPESKSEAQYPEEFHDAIREAGFNPDAMTPEMKKKAFDFWSSQSKDVESPEPPKVEAPKVEEPGDVQSPESIARRAVSKMQQDLIAKKAAREGKAPEPPKDQRNDVLEFIKRRTTGTLSQIQEQFGIPGDEALAMVKDFEKRGLVGRTGQRWAYKAFEHEEVGEPTAPDLTPPERAENERPWQAERREAIEKYQQQVKDKVPGAEKKLKEAQKSYGDRVDALRALHGEISRKGIKHEDLSKMMKERFGVKSMKELTPDQMREVQDELINERKSKTFDTNARIDELEDKEDKGTITPAETKELNELYKELGFWRSERGTERLTARINRAKENMQEFLHKVRGVGLSTDQFLEGIPETKPVAEIIKNAQVEGDKWEYDMLHKLEKQDPYDQLATIDKAYTDITGEEVPAHATLKDYLDTLRKEPLKEDEELSKIGQLREVVHRLKTELIDHPAATAARKFLQNIPDEFDRDTAQWYINNWTRRDLRSEGIRFLRRLDRTAATVGARGVLFGSTRLQVLHLARLGMQVWPELGEVNFLKGLGRFASHPGETWETMNRHGLLPSQTVPWSMKGGMEKFDTAGNFWDFGNSITKAVAFEGNLAKYKGDILKAVNETKRIEGVVGRETPIRALEWTPRSTAQFKYWVGKYFGNIAQAIDKREYGKLIRYAAAAVMLKELSEATGITLWHLRGSGIFDTGSPFFRTLKNASSALGHEGERRSGDSNLETAAKVAAKGFVPGGTSIGPALFRMLDGDVEGGLKMLGPFEKESHKK